MKTVIQNQSKQVLSFEDRWDPHNLDDENRKLSDITQNSLHPNKALVTILYKAKQLKRA